MSCQSAVYQWTAEVTSTVFRKFISGILSAKFPGVR
jgi:hypothetical protein